MEPPHQYEQRASFTLHSMNSTKLFAEQIIHPDGRKHWEFYYQHIPLDSIILGHFKGHLGQVVWRVAPHPASYRAAVAAYDKIDPAQRPPVPPPGTKRFQHDEVYYDLVKPPTEL